MPSSPEQIDRMLDLIILIGDPGRTSNKIMASWSILGPLWVDDVKKKVGNYWLYHTNTIWPSVQVRTMRNNHLLIIFTDNPQVDKRVLSVN